MHFLELSFYLIGILFLLGSLDDLIIDIAHVLNGIRPRKPSKLRWTHWRTIREKPLAIMIPAWQESAVLEAMVRTNLKRIKYRNYRWFIGVYPNDEATLEIAMRLEKQYPDMVTVVVTDRPGPTSKAHCLNCILRVMEGAARKAEKDGHGWIPHYVAIHDAEDVIHPEAFTAINGQQPDLDFIQVPIFSLPVSVTKWVAGTYLDEFAEIHLKEIPVRQILGMPIPSAGVGTFFSYRILMQMGKRFGYWFDEGNLTEDYEISLRIARLGGKQLFLLIEDEDGQIVATREYFPEEFGRSIRQKTRWTTGIGLQTMSKWGAFGVLKSEISYKNLVTAYAIWRDRKALWANPSVLAAWLLISIATALHALPIMGGLSGFQHVDGLRAMFLLNTALFSIRMFQRARFCAKIYGFKHGALSIPRVMLSTWINANACFRALIGYFVAASNKQQTKIVWDKTEHKFPDMEELTGERSAG